MLHKEEVVKDLPFTCNDLRTVMVKIEYELSLVKATDTAKEILYAHPGDAGGDVHADSFIIANGNKVPGQEYVLNPGYQIKVCSGLKLAYLTPGFEIQARPRSGLADKHGITVLNSPGTIDNEYRGFIQILLINHGAEPVIVKKGDRIAQLVVARVPTGRVTYVKEVTESVRGEAGFGSTGGVCEV